VVGLDNWEQLWLREYPKVCDLPWTPRKLNGFRFDTRNPRAGLFGGDDVFVTGPFQPFGSSNETHIRGHEKPNAAIYSVAPGGGDLRVEAHGIRYPRGLAFNEFGRLFFTNNGMEMRGTRPVKDDPDALLRLVPGVWYGWPDFSTDLYPITEERFQPPRHLIIKTGYPDLSFLIDHVRSELVPPERNTLLQATFPSLSGAAKMDFVPAAGPFKDFRGSVVIALSGDRSPFATSGQKLLAPVGFKVVRVDVDTRQVKDFVKNTANVPLSRMKHRGAIALERPIDVKFGPDGAMYILDTGRVDYRSGVPKISHGTGALYKLIPSPAPTTQP
jgi:glucose/arabinose dehydrogenase